MRIADCGLGRLLGAMPRRRAGCHWWLVHQCGMRIAPAAGAVPKRSAGMRVVRMFTGTAQAPGDSEDDKHPDKTRELMEAWQRHETAFRKMAKEEEWKG